MYSDKSPSKTCPHSDGKKKKLLLPSRQCQCDTRQLRLLFYWTADCVLSLRSLDDLNSTNLEDLQTSRMEFLYVRARELRGRPAGPPRPEINPPLDLHSTASTGLSASILFSQRYPRFTLRLLLHRPFAALSHCSVHV